MRNFINIIAENQSTVTLYRGDGSRIDQFDIRKTDQNALFGSGIYLTSDATVARDYSFARTYEHNSHKYSDVFTSQKELIADFLQHIIRDDLKWVDTKAEVIDQFRSRMWDFPYMRPEEPGYAEQEAKKEAIRAEASAAVRKSYAGVLKKAKAIYQERVANMVFVRNTVGEWKLLRKDWQGFVTHFNIPTAYVEQCLHGDRPLTDAALKMVRDTIYAISPKGDGWIDFRDEENRGTPFDNWLELFKTKGARYSWEGHAVGGSGANPSLDHIMNGTLSGYYIRRDGEDRLIEGFQKLGYVGIEYDGGVRTAGGHNRGGGGVMHRAFVFWDSSYINRCIVNADQTSPDAPEAEVIKKLTPAMMHKQFRDKI